MAEKRKADETPCATAIHVEDQEDGPPVFVLPDGTRVPSAARYRAWAPRALCDTLADPPTAFADFKKVEVLLLGPAHPWLVDQWGRDLKEFCGDQDVQYETANNCFFFELDGHRLGFSTDDNIARLMSYYRKPQRYLTFSMLLKKDEMRVLPKHDYWRTWFGSCGYGARYWSQNATWIIPADEVEEAVNYLCKGPALVTTIVGIEATKPATRGVSFLNAASELMHSALNDFTHGEEMERMLTYGRMGLFQKKQ